MTDLATSITIERVVLDGIAVPADDIARLPELLKAEVERILLTGNPTPETLSAAAPVASQPLILDSPPDVLAIARHLAERVVDEIAVQGAFDG